MTKTIALTDLVINYIIIDYEQQKATVNYKMIDADNKTWVTGEAIFWVTIPDPGKGLDGNPLPIPDNWFQLSASYFPTLVSLRNDADTALTSKFLV
jgi:hypothetical protein